MPKAKAGDESAWLADWLDAVARGEAAMSQRARSSINKHGGVAAAVAAAERRGMHFVELAGDKGALLVAVSRHPF